MFLYCLFVCLFAYKDLLMDEIEKLEQNEIFFQLKWRVFLTFTCSIVYSFDFLGVFSYFSFVRIVELSFWAYTYVWNPNYGSHDSSKADEMSFSAKWQIFLPTKSHKRFEKVFIPIVHQISKVFRHYHGWKQVIVSIY